MTLDEIRELVQVVNESGIAELEVQRGDDRVRIKRSFAPAEIPVVTPTVTVPMSVPVNATPVPPHAHVPAPAAAAPAGGPAGEGDTVLVKSPIVGTFYESPQPGAPAFVKVGDTVQPGQVLCIIESMKLMNEIEAEISGVVVAKLVESGHPVEYGEALFSLRPL
jgi:acetyl-CoA carboxylase biotin carboxyl carrier protein